MIEPRLTREAEADLDELWAFIAADSPEAADRMVDAWGHPARWEARPDPDSQEAQLIELDCSRAEAALGWRAQWSIDRTIAETIKWYRAYTDCRDLRALSRAQIDAQMLELA